jgi:proline iminopeptidase
MSDAEFSALWGDLDALPLVFKLDVLHWDSLRQDRLRYAIAAQGQTFWPLTMASDTRSA